MNLTVKKILMAFTATVIMCAFTVLLVVSAILWPLVLLTGGVVAVVAVTTYVLFTHFEDMSRHGHYRWWDEGRWPWQKKEK